MNFCNFTDLKAKDKTELLLIEYINKFVEKMTQLFVYKGLPDTVPSWAIEQILLYNGVVGIGKLTNANVVMSDSEGWYVMDGTNSEYENTNEPYAVIGNYTGKVGAYGFGDSFVGACALGSINGKVNEDVVVGWNNSLRKSDLLFINRYADLMRNIEISTLSNIIYTRIVPIPVADTDVKKKAYEDALKKIERGEMATVESKSTLDELLDGKSQVTTMDLSRPENVKNLSDLSMIWDECMKRFFIESGIDICTKDKKAQVTNAEIDSFSQYALVTLYDKLNCRKKMCEDLNRVFGWNCSVELNKFIFELDGVDNVSRETMEEPEENETKESEVNENVDE